MRIVLATGLFAIGVELPKAYVAEHVRSLLVMVVPTMAFGWLISAGKSHFAVLRQYIDLTSYSHYPRSLPRVIFRIVTRDFCMSDPD